MLLGAILVVGFLMMLLGASHYQRQDAYLTQMDVCRRLRKIMEAR
jgi:hypothetical protein